MCSRAQLGAGCWEQHRNESQTSSQLQPLGMRKPQTLIRSGRNIISALAGFIPKGEAILGYTPNS